MTNNYYARQETFTAGNTAQGEEVESELDAVLAGFDFLPESNTALVHGTATFATESGSADAYAIVWSPVRTAYVDGDEVIFIATNTNTGASTLVFDSLTPQSITTQGGSALTAGQIASGIMYSVRYDASNTRFVLLTPSETASAAASAAAAAASETNAATSETNAATSETNAAASATAAAASEAAAASDAVTVSMILGLFYS